MRRIALFLVAMLLTTGALAQNQCDALRATGLRLLPGTTFEVNYAPPLQGCFSGFLPRDVSMDKGLYRFGIFRDGKLTTAFPVVIAGMDLASNSFNDLKILAVSFTDLDHDGQRDVVVIGSRLAAKGEMTFEQIYWGCGNRFVFDDNTDAAMAEATMGKSVINMKVIQQIVDKKRLKSTCAAPSESYTNGIEDVAPDR